MKLLTSNCVGHDFWHGASAHFKQRAASRRAARSDSVVCFISEKSFWRLEQDDWIQMVRICLFLVKHIECEINISLTWQERSILRFHSFFSFFVWAVGTSEPLVWIRGFNESRFYWKRLEFMNIMSRLFYKFYSIIQIYVNGNRIFFSV